MSEESNTITMEIKPRGLFKKDFPSGSSKWDVTQFDDGPRLQLWDKKLADQMAEVCGSGKTVQVVVEEEFNEGKDRDGNPKTYRNLTIRKINSTTASTESSSGIKETTMVQGYGRDPNERQSIERQKALAEANAYAIAGGLSHLEAIAIAADYLMFIQGDVNITDGHPDETVEA